MEDHDSLLLAFDYAIGHKARVINASFTFFGLFPNWPWKKKIDQAALKGVVVVAAAGEDSDADLDNYAVYPCNFDKPNLICVTATTQSDTLVPGKQLRERTPFTWARPATASRARWGMAPDRSPAHRSRCRR